MTRFPRHHPARPATRSAASGPEWERWGGGQNPPPGVKPEDLIVVLFRDGREWGPIAARYVKWWHVEPNEEGDHDAYNDVLMWKRGAPVPDEAKP